MESLAAVNSYNPGLSSAWMLQRAMSVRPGKQPKPHFINSLLSQNFQMMENLGDPVMKPFLQVYCFAQLSSKELAGSVHSLHIALIA